VVERIFEHRIWQQIEVDDTQFGFMKGKETTDAIFTYLRDAYFVQRQSEIDGTKFHLKGPSETRRNCHSASLQRLQQKGVLQAAVDTTEHVATRQNRTWKHMV